MALSTHVLDAATGSPAVGMTVRWERLDGTELARGVTDDDGRVPGLDAAVPLTGGDQRLVFETGPWQRAAGRAGFYPEVSIAFTVTDASSHHHVPLLLAPFAYSTYRGS